MAETVIINLLDPSIAQMTAAYLNRRHKGRSFKVVQYYSEHHHVVIRHEISEQELAQIQAYAEGVSDVLKKIMEV
jgi:hypothetical protein